MGVGPRLVDTVVQVLLVHARDASRGALEANRGPIGVASPFRNAALFSFTNMARLAACNLIRS